MSTAPAFVRLLSGINCVGFFSLDVPRSPEPVRRCRIVRENDLGNVEYARAAPVEASESGGCARKWCFFPPTLPPDPKESFLSPFAGFSSNYNAYIYSDLKDRIPRAAFLTYTVVFT